MWAPKRKAKLGLWVANCKLYQLSQSFGLPTFSHFSIFSSFAKSLLFGFLVTLLAFVFSPPTKTLLFEIFLVTSCELLTSSMSFSSLVMNDHLMKRWSQYLQTMITTLLLTTCHKHGKLHHVEIIPILGDDSYVWDLHMTNMRKQTIHWKLYN